MMAIFFGISNIAIDWICIAQPLPLYSQLLFSPVFGGGVKAHIRIRLLGLPLFFFFN